MPTTLTDTHPSAERIQIELLWRTPAWRKLEILGQLNANLRTLVLSELRQRHPQASPQRINCLLAELTLGKELADQVYGEYPEDRP